MKAQLKATVSAVYWVDTDDYDTDDLTDVAALDAVTLASDPTMLLMLGSAQVEVTPVK